MKKSVWGPITWKLLHTFVLKIKDNITLNELLELKNIITRIVSNLPCPYCTSHAISYLATFNFKNIQNISHLRLFMFQFHNNVNQRLNKPLLTYEEHLQLYNIPINVVLTDYVNIYNSKNSGVTMMLYDFHRKIMIKDIVIYFKNNNQLFNS
jgi:hypothetical protein